MEARLFVALPSFSEKHRELKHLVMTECDMKFGIPLSNTVRIGDRTNPILNDRHARCVFQGEQ
jgi:hypothetical protein